ncbi:serine/threonine-protein kinase [Nostoc sp.]|uniref:serine/threonine-protein kinase n=1 Tax=Nostoc sp. TaxID=1180 RepID=UPI002FFA64A8
MLPAINQGTLINNRYLVQKLLGQGGCGRTYLAFDNQRFNEYCVLKESTLITSKAKIESKYNALFEREAKILYKIQHPQIPKFLACFTNEERLFIVQEYIDGNNYSEILSNRLSETAKPFSEAEVRGWLLDMLAVLEYVHGQQIIHRDISLENVMLPHNQSKPVLIDFGVAKDASDPISSTDSVSLYYSVDKSVVGRIGYSPPEQLRGGYSYPSSDIYSLGICSVVLLTGKMPHLLIDESLNWQWRSQVNISDSFASILEKMLAERANDRYQSATEIMLKLNNLQHNLLNNNVMFTPIQKPIKIACEDLEEFLVLQKLDKKLSGYSQKNSNLYLQNPINFKQNFIDCCRQELKNAIGIIADIIIDNALKKSSHFTPKQLVEYLIAEISNKKMAEEFKEGIYKHPVAHLMLSLCDE